MRWHRKGEEHLRRNWTHAEGRGALLCHTVTLQGFRLRSGVLRLSRAELVSELCVRDVR